ncbi:MAG: hypothetical protein RIB47_11590 [Cyclobacteriaceae bacterium]
MIAVLEIFPKPNTVQKLSKYFVDLGEPGLWYYFSVQAILFYVLIFLVLYFAANTSSDHLKKQSALHKCLISDITFIFFLFSFLLISRIPLGVTGQQNPDESTWIGIAKTLLHDPRFWLSVDTGTGGPLVPLMLTTLKLFGLPIDHATIKLVGSTMMAMSISAIYIFSSIMSNKILARVTVLPLVVVVSVMNYSDLIAYNSEHMVILVLSCSLVFFAQLYRIGPGKYNHNIILLALFLGMMPFAKLQGVPLALFIGIISIYILFRKKLTAKLPLLIGVALIPTIVVVLLVWSYGALDYFWVSYIKNNLAYATRHPITEDVFGTKMALLFKLLFSTSEISYFIYYSFGINLIALFIILTLKPKKNIQWIEKLMFGVLLFQVSIYCATAPNNFFPHYFLLLLIPIAVLTFLFIHLAWSVISIKVVDHKYLLGNSAIRLLLIILFILPTSFYYFQRNFTYKPFYLEMGKNFYSGYALYWDLTATLNQYYSEGARMSIWGWACSLHESTDFLMGTRYVTSAAVIDGEQLQEFITATYLSDLMKNKPLLFVQAIGPNYFAYYDTMQFRIENYPLIDDYIKANYSMVKEVEGAKVFLRNNKNINTWIQHKVNFTSEWNAPLSGYFDKSETENKLAIFSGWAVVGNTPKNQKAYIALMSDQDTLMVRASRYPRHDVVAAHDNWDWLESGYRGFIPIDSLKADEYDLGLFVKEGDSVLFKNLNSAYKVER